MNWRAGRHVDELMTAVDQMSVVLMQVERQGKGGRRDWKTQELGAPASEETFVHACLTL